MTRKIPADLENDRPVARATAGSEVEIRAIYEAHSAYVYRLALRLSGNGADAEDFTQEAFLAAWRSLSSFDGESGIRTWLHRIAVRVIWAGLKRRDAQTWLELDDTDDVGRGPEPVGERLDLERALASLPVGARTVLLLHQIEGLRYREIADQLDISIGTVKSQLHRARNLLMEYLS